MPLFKRLNLTRTLTSPRHIRTSEHPVHPWLPVTWSIYPRPPSPCDGDNGDSSTALVRAVEVQPPTYFRGGSENSDIGYSLRHSSWRVEHKSNLELIPAQQYQARMFPVSKEDILQLACTESRAQSRGNH
ncbi:AC5 [Hemidesmus yellow mosaic virus]|uniref:AC5 n=1 Tax=Hemidesmus yellow mosaic virus TaxID=1383052 RepID=S5VC61_9GEMI|nr:AC5 [Hemidesmus yellow mosaic virus]AGS77273.1 AC5 [Hemidesmus yellow mosaic virus]AGS77280.1 AC5 [Hemidesmus yellow mosaic virus]